MIKKIWSIIMGISVLCTPVFADVNLTLPTDSSKDLSINTVGNKEGKSTKILGQEVKLWTSNSTVNWGEDTIFATINLINKYLRRSFAVIAMGLFIYGGYTAITARGDSKALKKVLWILIGILIGLVIAMLSSALVKIIVNLI